MADITDINVGGTNYRINGAKWDENNKKRGKLTVSDAVKYAEITALPGSANPQVASIRVESSAGAYVLIATKGGLSLYDAIKNKTLWNFVGNQG